MSTANFSYPNTKHHYTIGVNEDLEDWEYEDIIDNVKEKLKAIGGVEEDTWIGRDKHCIIKFTFEYYDRDNKYWDTVHLYVTVESGYYAGAMFDIDNEDLEGLEICATTENKIDKTWNRIEAILKANTTPLVRIATFSNGEAIYELAK